MGYSFLVKWESQRHIWFIRYIQYSRLYDMGTELQVYRYIVSRGTVYIYICECIEAYICVYTYVCM